MYPAQLPYQLALAHAYSQVGQTADARELLVSIRGRFPDSIAARLSYAELLVHTGQPLEARRFILGDDVLLNRLPQAQELLAQAAGAENNLGEAYYRQARIYQMRGAYPRAINQLRTALQTADLDAFDKSRLRALLTQTVQACHAALSERECREQVEEDSRY